MVQLNRSEETQNFGWFVVRNKKSKKNYILFLHYYTFSFFRPGIAFFIHGINQVILFFMRFSIILEPKLKKKKCQFIHKVPFFGCTVFISNRQVIFCVHYGSTSCRVFKRGVPNQKGFCPLCFCVRINIVKGNC